MLLFGSFVGFLLSSLMLGLGTDAHSLKHEVLDFKHVKGIVLFYSDSVLADVIKELLKERVVRVFKHIKEVVFDHLE